MTTAHPIMRRFLSNPDTEISWKNFGERIFRDKLEKWCETGETLELFHEISNLVMSVVLNTTMGEPFAKQYAEELIPLIQEHEAGLQKPETKILPWWATKAGRIIKFTEIRFTRLFDKEVKNRLANIDKYKQSGDFLQALLNSRDQHAGTIHQVIISN